MAIAFAAFVVATVMWVAFAVALFVSPNSIDKVWQAFRDLPLIGQGVLGLLFLPVVAGLWIWETSWPYMVRLGLVAALGWWNIYIFFPRS